MFAYNVSYWLKHNISHITPGPKANLNCCPGKRLPTMRINGYNIGFLKKFTGRSKGREIYWVYTIYIYKTPCYDKIQWLKPNTE